MKPLATVALTALAVAVMAKPGPWTFTSDVLPGESTAYQVEGKLDKRKEVCIYLDGRIKLPHDPAFPGDTHCTTITIRHLRSASIEKKHDGTCSSLCEYDTKTPGGGIDLYAARRNGGCPSFLVTVAGAGRMTALTEIWAYQVVPHAMHKEFLAYYPPLPPDYVITREMENSKELMDCLGDPRYREEFVFTFGADRITP